MSSSSACRANGASSTASRNSESPGPTASARSTVDTMINRRAGTAASRPGFAGTLRRALAGMQRQHGTSHRQPRGRPARARPRSRRESALSPVAWQRMPKRQRLGSSHLPLRQWAQHPTPRSPNHPNHLGPTILPRKSGRPLPGMAPWLSLPRGPSRALASRTSCHRCRKQRPCHRSTNRSSSSLRQREESQMRHSRTRLRTSPRPRGAPPSPPAPRATALHQRLQPLSLSRLPRPRSRPLLPALRRQRRQRWKALHPPPTASRPSWPPSR